LRLLCIASGGGHLEQMLACLDAFQGHDLVLGHYQWSNWRDFDDPRLRRHVGIFLWGTSGLKLYLGTLVGVFQWLWLLLWFRPHAIFSTGAEIAIVPFWLGRVLFRARCVFMESAARKERPSSTGPLVYPVCTTFFVQSEPLLKHYGPKARYAGRLL